MSRWYRAYEGTVTDAKLGEVALVAGVSRSVAIAAWHCLLESASTTGAGGSYDTSPRRIAVILGEPVLSIEGVFAGLVELGMIADGKICAWSKRQYESDSSTERSRKSRERAKPVEATTCNGTATLQQQHATPSDTEAETDTPLPPQGGLKGDGFEEFWNAYPKRDGISDKNKAKLVYYGLIINHPPDDLIAAASAYRQWCVEKGKINTQFVKSAKLWLSEGHWADFVPKRTELSAKMYFCKPGMPQWDAWQAVKKTPVSEKTGGWHFATEWPPNHVNTEVKSYGRAA